MHEFIEVACDESGFSGTNLLDSDDRVFTHASVHLDAASAGELVGEVRARFPFSTVEYKSGRLRRPASVWLLEPSGPLAGRAHVHLTDKTFFAERRLVDVLLGESRYESGTSLDQDRRARSMAVALHRQGPAVFGAGPWRDLLRAFVTLMQTKKDRVRSTRVDAFLRTVDELPPSGKLAEFVNVLRRARFRMDTLMTRALHEHGAPPPLEPLMPALLETARYWSAGGESVSIVHDEQSALTRDRIRQIQNLLDGRLRAVRQVDSRSDPRVQVADFLAGTARRIASAELRGQGDDELTTLLRPYVDPYSIWADGKEPCPG